MKKMVILLLGEGWHYTVRSFRALGITSTWSNSPHSTPNRNITELVIDIMRFTLHSFLPSLVFLAWLHLLHLFDWVETICTSFKGDGSFFRFLETLWCDFIWSKWNYKFFSIKRFNVVLLYNLVSLIGYTVVFFMYMRINWLTIFI